VTRLEGPPAAVSARGRVSTGDEELAQLVATFKGTRRELATQVGMSEGTLYRRLKALGLD
jgi:transcriptional regulator of acetoin/glycerol metabolism